MYFITFITLVSEFIYSWAFSLSTPLLEGKHHETDALPDLFPFHLQHLAQHTDSMVLISTNIIGVKE